jgi:HEPN domain-containing protein
MNETVKKWTDQARYDLETARAMLDSGRYLYVPFCCQQSVEKMLKAVIAKITGEMPPRIHNLIQLCKRAGLEPDAEQALLMRELSEYYLQSRYPEEIEPASSAAWQGIAEDALNRTRRVVEWLSSNL